jgi:hypothetical protein
MSEGGFPYIDDPVRFTGAESIGQIRGEVAKVVVQLLQGATCELQPLQWLVMQRQ